MIINKWEDGLHDRFCIMTEVSYCLSYQPLCVQDYLFLHVKIIIQSVKIKQL